MDREKTQVGVIPERTSSLPHGEAVKGKTKGALRLAALGYALEDGNYRIPSTNLADKLIDRLRNGK